MHQGIFEITLRLSCWADLFRTRTYDAVTVCRSFTTAVVDHRSIDTTTKWLMPRISIRGTQVRSWMTLMRLKPSVTSWLAIMHSIDWRILRDTSTQLTRKSRRSEPGSRWPGSQGPSRCGNCQAQCLWAVKRQWEHRGTLMSWELRGGGIPGILHCRSGRKEEAHPGTSTSGSPSPRFSILLIKHTSLLSDLQKNL